MPSRWKESAYVAVPSGILTALAFPKFELSFLAWISLIPLLWILARRPPQQNGFWPGFLAGLFFYGILLYWIPDVPAHYGGMPYWLCLVTYLALIGFLALYWGLFGFLFARIRGAYPDGVFFLAPFLWIATEYVMTHFLTGFPWGILGTSQFRNLALIQTASLGGVYAVSFLLVLLQSTFVMALTRKKKSPFFAGLALIILAHAWGLFTLRSGPGQGESTIRASVIQGNVSSDIYWNQVAFGDIQRLFEGHLELTNRAYLSGARLIIWPEFTVPLCFSCEEDLYQTFKSDLENYVRDSGATLLLGTNEKAGPPGSELYFNTAMCLHPDLTRSLYSKMHLVPFGEYTPYKDVFFFVERMTHAIGDISPGTRHVLHEYAGYQFGSPICYEIIFPQLVRTFVWKGADFLVTITNDGWYGQTSAPYQHWAQAVFRAVENRRFLLRAATTGISGFVDPYGRILSQSLIKSRAVLTEDITPGGKLSLYTRFGDVLPWIGLTLSILFFILALFNKRKVRYRYARDREII